jgi:hypothetical protein
VVSVRKEGVRQVRKVKAEIEEGYLWGVDGVRVEEGVEMFVSTMWNLGVPKEREGVLAGIERGG